MSNARIAVLFVVLGSYATGAGAVSPQASGSVIPLFSIAKSENKNQVQYVVRVDDRCAPAGQAPVTAYWRMLERGPTQTEPILPREVRAYGVANQALVTRDEGGGQVRVVLNALPGRPMTVVTSRASDGSCRAVANMSIAGAPAHLFNVYVKLKWDGVDYLLLRGWSMDGSQAVTERLTS
jgi:Domain of unknown function (DUF4833)